MTDKELIALMFDALINAETQLDQISGCIEEDNDPEFYETLEEVREAINLASEHKENQ